LILDESGFGGGERDAARTDAALADMPDGDDFETGNGLLVIAKTTGVPP